MKAAYYSSKGKFELGDSLPQKPKKGEVRVEVAYCGVCGTDVHIFHGVMDQRIQPPQIVGHEASAVVVEVGPEVENVKPGDKVAIRPLKFGETHPYDKSHKHVGKNLKFIGIDSAGAFQETWTLPAYTLHKLPETLSLKHGAFIEPLSVACHDVKIGRVKAGENCLVIGGGPIGTLIAYVLKEKEANVILSEVNKIRVNTLRALGFEVVNPTTEDLIEKIADSTNTAMIDCLFDPTRC